MYQGLQRQAANVRRPRQTTIKYGPWDGGLLTELQPEQANRSQLVEAKNMILLGRGILRTRDGSTLVSSVSGSTPDIKFARDVKVGATWYVLMSASDKKLYKDVAGTATAIATLEGESRFAGFMGLLFLFDGSYLKMWDGTNLDIVYDNGTGSTAYQYNNRTGKDDGSLALGNATNIRVAQKVTTQAWDAGYTIPPTTVFARLSKTGTGGTGAIVMKIRLVSDDSVEATKTFLADVTTLSTTAVEYEETFDSTDITDELSPSVAYYVTLEYAGGDASNYVNVHYTTVASGGLAYHYIAAWVADTTENLVLGLKPGRPPKASEGIVHNNRLRLLDPDNLSYVWYCAAGNHLDWSTPNGGGYVAVVDDSSTSFPVGAIASFYERLWVFGTPRQPFLGQEAGEDPQDFAINITLQKVSAEAKSLLVTPNDILFLHPGGVDDVKTIQEFGDIRAETHTDNIRATIHTYFSSAAFAGYDPEWGTYLLKLASYDPIIAVHTRLKTIKYKGLKGATFSPCTTWEFNVGASEEPTCFGEGNGYMYIGTDAGKLYRMDSTLVDDNSRDVTYQFKTHYHTGLFEEMAANKIGISSFSRLGGQFDFYFYRDNSRTSFDNFTVTVPWDTTVLPSELTMPVEEMLFLVNPDDYYDRENLAFVFRTLQIGVQDVTLNGKPFYFGPIHILADQVGGL